jgi:hypothetical protein
VVLTEPVPITEDGTLFETFCSLQYQAIDEVHTSSNLKQNFAIIHNVDKGDSTPGFIATRQCLVCKI